MKRILLFSLTLVVVGCEEPAGRTDRNCEVYVQQYNGHQYLHFRLGSYGAGGVVHDPDCPCHSKTLTEWQQLQLAIAITESQCNPSATGETNDGGLLQIRPIYVSEVNRVSGTSYTHKDVYTPASAIDMFNRMQMYYNPEKDISKAIYYHNKSKDYKTKVIRSMEFVKRYENCRKVIVSYGE